MNFVISSNIKGNIEVNTNILSIVILPSGKNHSTRSIGRRRGREDERDTERVKGVVLFHGRDSRVTFLPSMRLRCDDSIRDASDENTVQVWRSMYGELSANEGFVL